MKLVQLEEEPLDIRHYNANIREERWTNFSLEGVRFPAMTVDVIQRGEALAIFERDLIIHFQQISKAAALYVRALLGGIKRALEVYRRVDGTTTPWVRRRRKHTSKRKNAPPRPSEVLFSVSRCYLPLRGVFRTCAFEGMEFGCKSTLCLGRTGVAG